jgi:hypothetical protein
MHTFYIILIHVLMHTGALLQDLAFLFPAAALFFNSDSIKLIVACSEGISIVDASTQSTQAFSDTPHGVGYWPHALALSDDDALLVAGNHFDPQSVSSYDMASRTRLWIHETSSQVGAACIIGVNVLATVAYNPTLVLDRISGTLIAELQKADGFVFGLAVIEGLLFILSPLILSDLHTSVYLAMLQHLLYRQAKPLHLPLEMWDWISKYRV